MLVPMQKTIRYSSDSILHELFEFSQTEAGQGLLQFQSLAGGRQYTHLYELTQKYVPSGSRVLDWGAGNGHFSYYLIRMGYNVTAFTLEDSRPWPFLPTGAFQFVRGDSKNPVTLPFQNDTFDAVFSVGVLEHVRETGGDESASLKEIHRVLRPGGYFICYHFPNQFSWIDFVVRLFPNRHYHPFRYSAESIRALTENAGLKLVECRRYGLLPRNEWRRLPGNLRASFLIADLVDIADACLTTVARPFCQNYYFIAKK